jgi:hypothetical protein
MMLLLQQIPLIISLSKEHHNHHPNTNINRIYVDKAYDYKEVEQEKSSKEDTFLIYVIEEKKTNYFIENILLEDG